ncbi:exodeoxyribonuclease III (plasmid) [Deinococcus metallilatus]|uniref:Exodeoxyribonuclease III n=1 Tax=Deinococcus metallilatus TaxID=1211322 RepID=A0AAJ5K1B0_9DEIO|nr:exodeoxyribonuclease III [Deinococcus metallilatus]MBB5297272.1 exodeoxyribonuclease-3 [Deinococcus metallilatus]QBY06981.1 exodeoxyribonuclease III [Deinococcus metallilatus]TLK31928.1 exodeoxyribonuclease III [Deinococcus metallilatus]GMA17164.1 exodeoxyribonuclease III [Deinococcus metallilatus]
MKLATWNVNSLGVRLPQVLAWLEAHRPDVLALQETKMVDERFPVQALAELGYTAAYAGQKTYNGVAILARGPLEAVRVGIPGLEDEQRRVVAATLGGVRVICLYVPNGQAVGSEKYRYKLAWLDAARAWLEAELAAHERLVVMGDFNVAPEDRDVHDPRRWAGQVLVSAPERAAFRTLLDLGLRDAFRLFEQPGQVYSWWNYGALAFRRNWGLRIDHLLVSPALAAKCRACWVDRAPRAHERPSDHAPVVAEFGS